MIALPVIPAIETERLRLVPPAAAHVPAMAAFHASGRAAALDWGMMPHEAWRHFAFVPGHHVLRGFGPFVAEAKADGRALGLFGPWWPEGQPEAEIKWTLWDGRDEGRGYAFEAARAMLHHAFATLGWTGAVSDIRHSNARSVAPTRRLGAHKDESWTTPPGTQARLFRHRPEGAA